MTKPSAYMIGIYYKDDEGMFDGIEEEDLVIAMKPTPENFKLAKQLLMDYEK